MADTEDANLQDVVLYHDMLRGPWAPSAGPFNLKLETFLRLTKIPYKISRDFAFSSKGKTPWISYNGVDVADSQFCIEYLTAQTGIDPDKHLSPQDRAIGRAFRVMAEERIYWLTIIWLYRYSMEDLTFHRTYLQGLSDERIREIAAKQIGFAHGQGTARHTKEEVLKLADQDLKALSDFLGEKPYLLGDEPCSVDCAVFGQLCQLRWHCPESPWKHSITVVYPRLAAYIDRIKARLWPDWEECITQGGTKEASK